MSLRFVFSTLGLDYNSHKHRVRQKMASGIFPSRGATKTPLSQTLCFGGACVRACVRACVCVYIYIYIYAVELKTGPRFHFYKLKLVQVFCFFVCFIQKSHSPCRKKRIFENKQKTQPKKHIL